MVWWGGLLWIQNKWMCSWCRLWTLHTSKEMWSLSNYHGQQPRLHNSKTVHDILTVSTRQKDIEFGAKNMNWNIYVIWDCRHSWLSLNSLLPEINVHRTFCIISFEMLPCIPFSHFFSLPNKWIEKKEYSLHFKLNFHSKHSEMVLTAIILTYRHHIYIHIHLCNRQHCNF